MKKQVVFVSDFFKEDILGGAEINDDAVVQFFAKSDLLSTRKHSHEVTPQFISENADKLFFISNFVNLSTPAKACLYNLGNYVLYEHDYKFLKSRNPIHFPGFIAPAHEFTNVNFYKGAKKVICLSKMHMDIFDSNLKLKNLTNVHCSMFTDELLEYLVSLSDTKKNNKYAVINSNNPTKRMDLALSFCKQQNLPFEVIGSKDNKEFLKQMSQFEKLVVTSGHPEPTPRTVVEAKVMNCKIVGQKHLIGVASEYWFHLNGKELAEELKKIREKAFSSFLEYLK